MSVFIWSGRRFIKSNKIPPSRNSADARPVGQIRPNHDTHREPVVCTATVSGGGRPMTGRGQSKEGSGGDPITYPTDVPFGSKKISRIWYKF
jgi:hypothetical protein